MEIEHACPSPSKPCLINPVMFGRLIESVEAMSEEMKGMRSEIKTLTEFKNNGKGILIGVSLAAGGVGAMAAKISGWILR